MKISVIIPVYNTEKYLRECLNSVLRQTYVDLEVIAVDDGSTDGSGDILENFAKTDKRLKVIRRENGGVSRARNTGLKAATGEYVAFVDSDDTINPDMYKTLESAAEKTGADIVTSDIIVDGIVKENLLVPDILYDKARIRKEVLPQFTVENGIYTYEFTTKIIKREILKGIEFYEGFSFQEDTMFMICAFAAANSLVYVKQAFYNYRPLPTGLYKAYRKTDGKKFLAARRLISGLIEKYDIEVNKDNSDGNFLYHICWFCYRTNKRIKDGKERKRLIEEVLKDDYTIEFCKDFYPRAVSFDKRIVKAISGGNIKKAMFYINFVYSGEAVKIQKFIAAIKGRK